MNPIKPNPDLFNRPGDQLEAAVVAALERKPTVLVPADFTARVAASLPAPATRKSRTRRVSIARTSALAAAATLTTTLFIIAPHIHADHLSLGLGLEMLLLAQLGGIGYGLMRLRESGL